MYRQGGFNYRSDNLKAAAEELGLFTHLYVSGFYCLLFIYRNVKQCSTLMLSDSHIRLSPDSLSLLRIVLLFLYNVIQYILYICSKYLSICS